MTFHPWPMSDVCGPIRPNRPDYSLYKSDPNDMREIVMVLTGASIINECCDLPTLEIAKYRVNKAAAAGAKAIAVRARTLELAVSLDAKSSRENMYNARHERRFARVKVGTEELLIEVCHQEFVVDDCSYPPDKRLAVWWAPSSSSPGLHAAAAASPAHELARTSQALAARRACRLECG